MTHPTDRAQRLEQLRVRALARHRRRQRRMVAAQDAPVNPWAGRHTGKQLQRIREAERLAEQARVAYPRIARAAWDAAQEDVA